MLFSYRNFAIATICSVAGFLPISGLLPLLVVQLQLLLGYSSTLAGLVYLTMIFSAAPLVAFIHELVKGADARLMVCINFLGFSVTFTWLGLFDKPASFDQILWPMAFYGVSLAGFFTPLATLAVHGLPAAKLLRAAEELTLVRTAAGAFGIALGGVVLFRRTPFHQLDLADHFGGRRFASLDVLSDLSSRLQASGFSAKMALGQMGRLIRQESALLSVNDAFLLAAAIFFVLAAFVWFADPTIARPPEKLRAAEAEEMME
jgi:DHA2 family multidrug resistance protein